MLAAWNRQAFSKNIINMETIITGYIIGIEIANRPLNKRPIITLSLECTDRNAITLTELTLNEKEVEYLIHAMFMHHPITLATEIRYTVIRKEI